MTGDCSGVGLHNVFDDDDNGSGNDEACYYCRNTRYNLLVNSTSKYK